LPAFEPGRERIAALEGTAPELHSTGSLAQIPIPLGLCSADGHGASPFLIGSCDQDSLFFRDVRGYVLAARLRIDDRAGLTRPCLRVRNRRANSGMASRRGMATEIK